jgi:hypothetical protein
VKEVRIFLTDEQYNALAQLSYDAEVVYKREIPLSAVIMATAVKGIPAVRYELECEAKNTIRTLRLVK